MSATTLTHRTWATLDLASSETITQGSHAGHVVTEIDILELVPQEQAGGAGKFHCTPELADIMVANHAAEAAKGYEPPVVFEHDGRKPVGWIQKLSRVGSRLRMEVRLLQEFAGEVKANVHRYVSPEFRLGGVKGSEGQDLGAKLFRVAVTATPHQKGADGHPVGEFQLSAIVVDGINMSEHEEVKLMDPNEETTEDELTLEGLGEKVGALAESVATLAETVAAMEPVAEEEMEMSEADKAEAKAELSEHQKAVATLSDKLDGQIVTLNEKLVDSDKRVTKLTEELATERKGQDDTLALSSIEAAIQKGQLKRARLSENWKDEPTAAIEALGFSSRAAFNENMDAIPENQVVDLSEREGSVSAPSDTKSTTDDQLVELGFIGKDGKPDRERYERAFRLSAE